jgi:hypothetical protein
VGPRGRPELTITDLDAELVRVTVGARDGDVLDVPLVHGGCAPRHYHVRRSWHAAAPVVLARASLVGEELGVSVSSTSELWWTRIDWAYSQADLDAGVARTYVTPIGVDAAMLRVAPGEHNVFLRITEIGPDDAPGVAWQGWIHLGRGAPEDVEVQEWFGSGPLPPLLAGVAASDPNPAGTRAVPPSPATESTNAGVGSVAVALVIVALLLGGAIARIVPGARPPFR